MLNLRIFSGTIAIVAFMCASRSDAQGPTIEVQAVIKGTANLPCNIRPPVKNDSTILVVWYRNEMDAIYSYDSRGRISEPGTHWKNNSVIGNRAFFRTSPDPATLLLEDVKPSDSGSYRCRVDFQRSPTKNNKVRLQVIQPPEKPVIYDQRGKVTSNAGPYEENSDVKFICRVRGGYPVPKVKWWRNEVLLDSTVSINNSDQFVESELTIAKVSRSDLKATYTCQASNNNITVPQSAFVMLDLYLSPLTVSILSSHQPLSADRKYEVVCQAVGSRPPAKITWWKDNERLTNYTDEISSDTNVTISTLIFTPVVKDHNRTLICRAINPKIKTAVDEDTWVLDITFLPVPVLSYGPQILNPNKIKEEDTVYFSCNVYANPRAYKIIWKHNGFIVQSDIKSNILANGATLELGAVKRHQSGNYTCFASNVEGDNESNALELRVMYKPVCKSNQKFTYGFAQNESARVSCEVDAYPFADAFSWSLGNGSKEVAADGETQRKPERKRNVSIFHITPVSEVDYGSLECSAKNEVGGQTEPCIFHLIPADRPHPPQNCIIVNQTTYSLGVECLPGFDGGQSPSFVLNVVNEDSGISVFNSTASTPSFFINDLSPGTSLTINLYAQNERGRSQVLTFEASTLNAAEKRTGLPTVMNLTPYVVLLVGMAIFCSISAVIIIGAVRARTQFSGRFFSSRRNSASMKQDLSTLEQTIKLNVADDDERNPDVIPNTKEDEYEAMHLDVDIKRCSSAERFYERRSPSSPTPTTDKEQEAWRLTNSVPRNGDVHRYPRASQKPANCIVDHYADQLLREPVDKPNNCQPERTVYAQIDRNKPKHVNNVKPRPQHRLQNASPCNVIRAPSQKEIVTVRSALVSNQQESCV